MAGIPSSNKTHRQTFAAPPVGRSRLLLVQGYVDNLLDHRCRARLAPRRARGVLGNPYTPACAKRRRQRLTIRRLVPARAATSVARRPSPASRTMRVRQTRHRGSSLSWATARRTVPHQSRRLGPLSGSPRSGPAPDATSWRTYQIWKERWTIRPLCLRSQMTFCVIPFWVRRTPRFAQQTGLRRFLGLRSRRQFGTPRAGLRERMGVHR